MNKESKWLAYMALAIVCTVWGTTYFAIKVGVQVFPPFLFSGIRHAVSGLLLLALLQIFTNAKPSTWKNIKHQSILGILMVAFGNGVIGWSERFIPSGLAAIIVSVIPVFVILLNYFLGVDKKKPSFLVIVGLLLGFLGILLIFKDSLRDIGNSNYRNGLLMAFAACISLAAGTVYSKKIASKNSNIIQNSAFQLLGGGATLLLMSVLFDNYSELKNINKESISALAYLIVFGSILGYSCFVYALNKLPLGLSSLYAYINPFVALLLGSLLLDEHLTGFTLLALLFALAGVYFINRGYRKTDKEDETHKIS